MAMTTSDEQVHLERYDTVWPQRFQTERDRICVAFGWEASAVEHIMDALLGTEQIVHQGDRIWQDRASDGAFGTARHPKFTRVSAVMVVSNLVPWSIAQCEPVLYCNPWCSKPELSTLSRLGRVTPPKMMVSEREPAAEIFGISADWPGFD